MTALRSDDRVLFLAIPPDTELANIARILMRGVVVALGTETEVEEGRRSMADWDNVLFLSAAPNRIPWRSAYFTKIMVPPQFEPILSTIANELHRLLAPGGEIVRMTVPA
ncbi:MAG TPA: hypothetical protein VFB14_28925 [Bryobacteraceae bacterium]|nr:hypothetical protein [Bryobacteraceae bacterium]